MGLLAMDGFKNSTKTQYSMGGYAKGGSKFGKVMGEFKAGTLHSGSKKGAEVTNPKQAVAIALSEARKAGAKSPMKKQVGGAISDAVRRQLENEINDMGPADRARALKMLGRTPESMPAPKKSAPVASRKPYVPSITEGAGDEALIAKRQYGGAADKDFMVNRAEQLKGMVGKAEGGKADLKQDKAMVKKAVHKHEAAMHPGKPMTKLRKGGMPC